MIKGAAVVGFAVLGSCASPVDCTSAPPVPLLGAWTYSATQTSPTTASLAGTLDITGQCGSSFTGTLDVTETDAQGSRPLAGTVIGRALDSASVDFDAFLSAVGRRHIGSIARDSMRGTWVETGGAGGSFVGVKAP